MLNYYSINVKKRSGYNFIIIAILIVASVSGYFLFKNKIGKIDVPTNIQPIETAFLSCLEDDVLSQELDVLNLREDILSCRNLNQEVILCHFLSQLNFLGNPIPIGIMFLEIILRGNKNRSKKKKEFMESELENFINGQIKNCNLGKYYQEGYKISSGVPEVDVIIRDKRHKS